MGLEARMPPLQPAIDAEDHDDYTVEIEKVQELPVLTPSPIAYPGSCLAISKPLIACLQSVLAPSPSLTLSIGSGFGLLEAYLNALPSSCQVIGVEVEPSSNKYLPASHHRVVHGTRFLEPLAAEATTWLFVYPRRVGLVQEYMSEYGEGAVRKIVWAGPKADWDDYKGCFVGWDVDERSADEVGGRAWELVAIATRRVA
jgi:hypothetical protein